MYLVVYCAKQLLNILHPAWYILLVSSYVHLNPLQGHVSTLSASTDSTVSTSDEKYRFSAHVKIFCLLVACMYTL